MLKKVIREKDKEKLDMNVFKELGNQNIQMMNGMRYYGEKIMENVMELFEKWNVGN